MVAPVPRLPRMRQVAPYPVAQRQCARMRIRRRQAGDMHRKIIAALRAGDDPGLRLAIRTDVTQGLRMLVS